MLRSEEKIPMRATFRIALVIQASWVVKSFSASWWVERYDSKSAIWRKWSLASIRRLTKGSNIPGSCLLNRLALKASITLYAWGLLLTMAAGS